MLIPIFVIMFKAFLVYGILHDGHRLDGNVWAIYMENNHLMIGDFWHALLVLWLIYAMRDDVNDLVAKKKEGR